MSKQINEKSMLPVGTILDKRYRIDRYLSSGGFGNTYVATNVKFGNVIAVKEFFISSVSQRESDRKTVSVSNPGNGELFESQLKKFNTEAQRIFELKNPHIIGVHDLFDENGTAYYIMDFIDGESLAERLKRIDKPLPESEVRKYVPPILDALKTVHSKGFFHLDLKPGNVMRDDKTGHICLIDFGASKQEDKKGGARASSLVCFTEGYAPVEQCEQNVKKFGPWTDIYALGATLYALLTNTHPPKPSDILDDDTPDKREALPFPSSVSKEMRDMIRWMMAYRKDDRPQSVQEIQQRYFKEKETEIPTKKPEKKEPLEAKEIDVTIVHEKEKEKKDPNFVIVNDDEEPTNRNKILIYFLIAAALTIGGYYLIPWENTQTPAEVVDKEEAVMPEVEDMFYSFPSLEYSGRYSGEVDENDIPNGKGKASFENGWFYEGEFVNGNMEGEGKFDNGENLYEGTFQNNNIIKGKMTFKDGTSFVGTFNDDWTPKEGTMFTREGKAIEKP